MLDKTQSIIESSLAFLGGYHFLEAVLIIFVILPHDFGHWVKLSCRITSVSDAR